MSYSGKSRVDIDRDRNGAVEKLLGVEDVVYFLILQKIRLRGFPRALR